MSSPGLGTMVGLCPCTDCDCGCSYSWKQFTIIWIPVEHLAWINGIISGNSPDEMLNPRPVLGSTEWATAVRNVSDLLASLDFDSPPAEFSDPIGDGCPEIRGLQLQPFQLDPEAGEYVDGYWCPSAYCIEPTLQFLDAFPVYIATPFPHSVDGGPQGGITIYPGDTGGLPYGLSAVTLPDGDVVGFTETPYVFGSKVQITGRPVVCQSLRDYEGHDIDTPTVSDCGAETAVAGKVVLPLTGDYPLTCPAPPYAHARDYHSRARCAWLYLPCGDCACP